MVGAFSRSIGLQSTVNAPRVVMARKVVNRKQLREEAEAAEAKETKKAKAVKKKPVKKKRRSKSKDPDDQRLKIFWGVYNHALKRVAKYEFNQKKAAQKRADELTAEGKPHFVQKDKEPVEEV
jgi:hypothetical protein